MTFAVELVPEIGSIPAADWDALVGEDDPFIEHAFLLALEASRSVGGRSGWVPMHVTVREAGKLVGALPLYLKVHSYGEYIFDFAWADAAERAGIRYYPKLVSMVPFTPATGRHVLVAERPDPLPIVRALLDGLSEAQARTRASSSHLLFVSEPERDLLLQARPLLSRESLQYHFHNDGYRDFEDYLGRMRSAVRKQTRRERKQALEGGVEIFVRPGDELEPREFRALYAFYLDTCHKRGSGPYLTQAFFELLERTHARRVLAVLAYRDGTPIAGTLNFQKGKHLYGRYWGCREEVPALHFECCYYRLIEHAIASGLRRFEAGAQGSHKLKRGFLPAPVFSVHEVAHPGLRAALARHLPAEAEQLRSQMAGLSLHGPFRRG
jgi:predicted N-acyltransferase